MAIKDRHKSSREVMMGRNEDIPTIRIAVASGVRVEMVKRGYFVIGSSHGSIVRIAHGHHRMEIECGAQEVEIYQYSILDDMYWFVSAVKYEDPDMMDQMVQAVNGIIAVFDKADAEALRVSGQDGSGGIDDGQV